MAKIKHGHALKSKWGYVMSPTYISWTSMKQRCLNPNHNAFSHYGGENICICERWINSFDNFLEDMGERPFGKTLDRINPFGNYEPENCRWATKKEQANNFRRQYIPYKGQIVNIHDILREKNIPFGRFRSRIYAGWTVQEALLYKPADKKPKCIDFPVIPDIHRTSQMKWLRERGCTLRDIGSFFNISHQRVAQIIYPRKKQTIYYNKKLLNTLEKELNN